jgi:hypothetical protein
MYSFAKQLHEGHEMIGYSLDMFKNSLTRVPAHRRAKPRLTVDIEGIFGADRVARLKDHFSGMDIQQIAGHIPLEACQKWFTFDQLCKLRYNRSSTMERTVEKAFEDEPEYAIVHKIQNSMWRWGCGSGVWNEVVDAYNAIRSFTIPVEGFEVRLDFTTYYNERGRSRESRTYLDGVFGFLVYYKGEHVMTLGFSIMAGRRVLVQQVQLTKRKGNRFLFRLPENRVEFFLQCFAKAFPLHTLCIADGGDIASINIASYKNSLDKVLDYMKSYPDEDRVEEKEYLETSVSHLTADLPRLTAIYANTGSFARSDQFFTVNRVRHYPLAA